MDDDNVELVSVVLGFDPYVLIECATKGDDEQTITLRAGGGVATKEQLSILLLGVLEEVTGVPSDAYRVAIDAERAARGLPPLVEEPPQENACG